MKSLFGALVISLCCALTPVTFATAGEPGQHNINWNALALTTQQKDAMRKHDEVWKRAFEQLYPEIIAERKHLNVLLLSQETDPEAVFQALRHLEDKEQELRYEAVKNFLMKKQELTIDQRKLLQPGSSAASQKQN